MRSDVMTALAADVDALCRLPVASLSMAKLQAVGAAVAPLAHRLDGLLSTVVGELEVRGSGLVPDREDRAVPAARPGGTCGPPSPCGSCRASATRSWTGR